MLTVLISRHWDQPDVHVEVTDERIGVAMALEDFMAAFRAEPGFMDGVATAIGNPTLLFTQAGLRKRLAAADLSTVFQATAESVCAKMKAETTRV